MNSPAPLLRLLQSVYLHGELPPDFGNEEYEVSLRDMVNHDLASQVYSKLRSFNLLTEVPEYFRRRLHARYLTTVTQNALVKHELLTVCSALEKGQIQAVPLKGVVLAEQYFGELGARPTGDIDILVHKEQVPESIQCLKALGFTPEGPLYPWQFHRVLSRRLNAKYTLILEVHWNFIQERTSDVDLHGIWSRANPLTDFFSIKALSLEDTFYTLCLHGANHRMESMKYALDILHMIAQFRTELSFDRLLAQARRDQTFRRVFATLRWVYRLLPELHEVKPLPAAPQINRIPDFRQGENHMMMLDSWRYRWPVIKDKVWPSRDLVNIFVGGDNGKVYKHVYLEFYKKRLQKIARHVLRDHGRDDYA